MIFPIIIKHKSASSCYKSNPEPKEPKEPKEPNPEPKEAKEPNEPKEPKEPKEANIDLEISMEYMNCLKKFKAHEICKDLNTIFYKEDL